MVDFNDHQRPQCCKKRGATTEDFVLSPFHIYLDQLRRWSTGRNEIIQRDGCDADNLAFTIDGLVAIIIDATPRLMCCAAAKGDSIDSGTRPYGGM